MVHEGFFEPLRREEYKEGTKGFLKHKDTKDRKEQKGFYVLWDKDHKGAPWAQEKGTKGGVKGSVRSINAIHQIPLIQVSSRAQPRDLTLCRKTMFKIIHAAYRSSPNLSVILSVAKDLTPWRDKTTLSTGAIYAEDKLLNNQGLKIDDNPCSSCATRTRNTCSAEIPRPAQQ
jgi:hypothetical protein